jgi:hypothetical protein
MPALRQIVREAASDDYRFSAILAGIVTSEAFLSATVPGEPDETVARAAVNR